jgi:glutathione synthase/RimK-type ligase-like ATP-grasp enzyme
VIVRSTWDYVFQVAEFRNWITSLEKLTRVMNHPSIMRWNMDKAYLLDLQEQGIPMAKMERIEPDVEALTAAMDRMNIDQAVVKPLISNSAHGLSLVDRGDRKSLLQAITLLNGLGLVQELIPEISRTGEISLVFFYGEYSHAILKKPKNGDIRVQTEFGGQNIVFEPDQEMIEEVRKLLDHCSSVPAYARVDVVQSETTIKLMELELIEPDLFFDLFPDGAENFVRGMNARL